MMISGDLSLEFHVFQGSTLPKPNEIPSKNTAFTKFSPNIQDLSPPKQKIVTFIQQVPERKRVCLNFFSLYFKKTIFFLFCNFYVFFFHFFVVVAKIDNKFTRNL